MVVVKDSFLNGSSWNLTAAEVRRSGDPGWDDFRVNPKFLNYTDVIQTMQRDSINGVYQEKNLSACFEVYDDYWAAQGNVVIFVKNQSVQTPKDDSVLIYTSIIPRNDDWAKQLWALGNGTQQFVANSPPHPISKWFLGPPRYEVDHCLVQTPVTVTTRCRFEYSPQIMVTVCLLNFTKAFVMLCIWLMRKWQSKEYRNPQKEVLYTLGDAIASFMREPDPTTANMSLATKYDFQSKRTLKNRLVKQVPNPSQEPREWKYVSKSWMSAASLRRWLTLLTM